LLGPARVVVLGGYPVPDQAAPDQLREEYQEEAKAGMEPVVRAFAERGIEHESILVFTRDRVQTQDRIANEYDCDAVFIPGHVESLDRVLVSLKDEQNMFRVLEVVGLLMESGHPEVTCRPRSSAGRGGRCSWSGTSTAQDPIRTVRSNFDTG
jgi:hypothetical protein